MYGISLGRTRSIIKTVVCLPAAQKGIYTSSSGKERIGKYSKYQTTFYRVRMARACTVNRECELYMRAPSEYESIHTYFFVVLRYMHHHQSVCILPIGKKEKFEWATNQLAYRHTDTRCSLFYILYLSESCNDCIIHIAKREAWKISSFSSCSLTLYTI